VYSSGWDRNVEIKLLHFAL